MSQLPDTLPVIPLENKVLLPAVVLKITMRGRDASVLTRRHFRAADQRKGAHLVCIPLKSLPGETSANKPSEEKAIVVVRKTNSNRQAKDNDPQQHDGLEPGLVKEGDKERLHDYGCAARILRVQRSGLGVVSIFLEGVARVQVKDITYEDNSSSILLARVNYIEKPPKEIKADDLQHRDETIAFKALCREFLTKMRELQMPDSLLEQLGKLIDNVSPVVLADMLVSIIETSFEEKLWMLQNADVLKISEQIHSSIEGKLSKSQREFYLRQQLEAIKRELGESEGSGGEKDEDDVAQLNRRLTEADLPQEAATVAQRELKRLKKLQPSSSEWGVIRNYLELMADLPWSKKSDEVIDIHRAKEQLENDHFGLDHVKKRIIEYLSVIKIKGDLKAPIICLVGPPGVGKTSLGRSIATALSREFHRISLGGVRDEADMRGHRRTYVGAMPGLIIQGLRKVGVNNPLFLLDEVDKLVNSTYYGDPAAALLEVLDPEQNNTFSDHYLNVPFDLSNVLFIATANSLDTIPGPLLDRMEVIQLNGYTFEEKLHIARSHLLPKQIKAHGLDVDQVTIADEVLLKIAENYTRESGVRTLERTIASVVRAKCVEIADKQELNEMGKYIPQVKLSDLEEILGIPTFEKEVAEREPYPGVVTGLAYSGSGNGGILFVEATKMPGKGDLQLTGSLGDVIKESAQIALTWVKAHAYALKIAPTKYTNIVENYDIHIHFPGGAVPKDGPSAGVTLVSALVSLFSGYCVKPTTAMTGEVSLRGQVLPVGGIKEKVISAHRAGIRKIIMPQRNRKDVEADVPQSVKQDIKFVYAKTIWDVLESALELNEDTTEKWSVRALESHL
ncbi:ATP-dependent protease La [Dichotomocladium elegans]|nr:ATP-dependent protease La [Dichotomocladium elegans]